MSWSDLTCMVLLSAKRQAIAFVLNDACGISLRFAEKARRKSMRSTTRLLESRSSTVYSIALSAVEDSAR
jgi:hypothetical protein